MTNEEITSFVRSSSTARILDAMMPAYLVGMVMEETAQGMIEMARVENDDSLLPPPHFLDWCRIVNDHLGVWLSAFPERKRHEAMRRLTRGANKATEEFRDQTMVKALVGVVEFYQIAVDLGLATFPEGEYATALDEFLDDVSTSETLPKIERSAKKQGRKILPKLIEAGFYRDAAVTA